MKIVYYKIDPNTKLPTDQTIVIDNCNRYKEAIKQIPTVKVKYGYGQVFKDKEGGLWKGYKELGDRDFVGHDKWYSKLVNIRESYK